MQIKNPLGMIFMENTKICDIITAELLLYGFYALFLTPYGAAGKDNA